MYASLIWAYLIRIIIIYFFCVKKFHKLIHLKKKRVASAQINEAYDQSDPKRNKKNPCTCS